MEPLLVILNPRRIAECVEAFEKLDIPKAWLTGYTEFELATVLPRLVEQTAYSHYVAVSDDVVVTPGALSAVLGLLEENPVATGYCNLDATDRRVNLTRRPFRTDEPVADNYDFFNRDEITDVTRSWFTGMCLTAMGRDLWLKYPFRCPLGFGSDLSLSWRLQQDDVPIVAPENGFVFHVKERWSHLDREPRKRLLIGEVPAEVRIES